MKVVEDYEERIEVAREQVNLILDNYNGIKQKYNSLPHVCRSERAIHTTVGRNFHLAVDRLGALERDLRSLERAFAPGSSQNPVSQCLELEERRLASPSS